MVFTARLVPVLIFLFYLMAYSIINNVASIIK